MVTFKQTLADLSADFRRRRQLEGKSAGLLSALSIMIKPGMVTVFLYRLSRFCFHHHLRVLCKLFVLIDQFYTKNEISPVAQIGPGLVIADAGGVGITQVTIAGSNCTFLGCNSITLGALEGFDVNQQHIVLGNHCVVGTRVRIMRPVNLADGTQIKANSVVMFSVEKVGCVISGLPAKRRSIEDYEKVTQWNPLLGGFLGEGTL
jgi:serine acetyltransferase